LWGVPHIRPSEAVSTFGIKQIEIETVCYIEIIGKNECPIPEQTPAD
jgi:hypothetical protein